MTKEEVDKILQENNIKKDGSWFTYERAKKIILEDMPGQQEYRHRIKLISDYLRI